MTQADVYTKYFLMDYWYVAATAEEVGRELLGRTFLGRPVVLYRTLTGNAVALHDACSHRKLPLSRGRLIGDTLQCGYHGWEFDCAGTCVKVPTTDHIANDLGVKSYPVIERYGLVWIWLGDDSRADPAHIPNCDHLTATRSGSLFISAHYQLIIENLLDLSHVTFVHTSYQGHSKLATVSAKSQVQGDSVIMTRTMTGAETPPLWHQVMGLPLGSPMDHEQRLEFHAPAVTFVKQFLGPADDPSRRFGFSTNHFLVPDGLGGTHYSWLASLDWPNPNPDHLEIFRQGVVQIADQDKTIIEAQQANMDLLRGKEFDPPQRSVPFDRTALLSRQVLNRLIKRAQSTSVRAAE